MKKHIDEVLYSISPEQIVGRRWRIYEIIPFHIKLSYNNFN